MSSEENFSLNENSKLNTSEFKRLNMENFNILSSDFDHNEAKTASYLNPPKIYRQVWLLEFRVCIDS